MFVKRLTISQVFPTFIDSLSIICKNTFFSDNSMFLYDIETTGLSRSASYIYLIGAIAYEEQESVLYQWFAESKEEEPLLLEAFSNFVSDKSFAIQYNGDRFDQPFIETRCEKYSLSSPFVNLESYDLYKNLRKCQAFLKLDRMKQPDLEKFLGFSNRCHCDGGECIRLYKKYQKTKDSQLLDIVLGHNEEDLMGLIQLFSMTSYLALYESTYTIGNCTYDIAENKFHITLQLPSPVPVPVSNGNEQFYLQVKNNTAQLLIPVKDGRLQQFYSDCNQYVYLISEDSVIPRSLSTYMDKSLYTRATAENCYTWFPCNEAFLQDSAKQMQYISHALPHFLQTLN